MPAAVRGDRQPGPAGMPAVQPMPPRTKPRAGVRRICDEVVVMDTGEVIAQGPFAGLRDNPRVVDAYLGMDQSHE